MVKAMKIIYLICITGQLLVVLSWPERQRKLWLGSMVQKERDGKELYLCRPSIECKFSMASKLIILLGSPQINEEPMLHSYNEDLAHCRRCDIRDVKIQVELYLENE